MHRFGIKLKKLSGGLLVNRRARVQIVYFSLDGRRSGSDRKRPYYALVAGRVLTAGRHVLRADVEDEGAGDRQEGAQAAQVQLQDLRARDRRLSLSGHR